MRKHSGNTDDQKRRRRRKRNTSLEILNEIEKSAGKVSAARIHQDLLEKFGEGAPSLRTVEEIVREVRGLDDSAPWSLAEAEDDPASGQVLEVLGAVVRETGGRIRHLTNSEAQWIRRLRAAFPDVPPYSCYLFARWYLLATRRGESTTGFDLVLSLAPWRDPGPIKEAAERGWLSPDGAENDWLHYLGNGAWLEAELRRLGDSEGAEGKE